MEEDMIKYYSERANEYENIYRKPERQEDILKATIQLQEIFSGADIFEIACGTGFWTERMAITANQILATDLSEEVLSIARNKQYEKHNVVFQSADIFNLPTEFKFKNLFGGFIWSHIPFEKLPAFLDNLIEHADENARFVFMDNNFVAQSSTPVSEIDAAGNTFQIRQLQNGQLYKVLKNFPTEESLRLLLKGKSKEIQFIDLTYFWILIFSI
ncbi:MAG: methyltransferase domain-containing protein [Chitinophagaceae bacterium]